MPSTSISLIPGLNTNRTPTLNEAGISATNNVRFKDGLVQKRGGYGGYSGGGSLGAVPRAICPYKDSSGNLNVAVGVTNALKTITSGVMTDITPVIVTATTSTVTSGGGGTYVTPSLATTGGSKTVTVTDQNYGVSVNDTIKFTCPTAIGGIILFGSYTVTSVISSTQYTITATQAATSTATGFTLATFTTTSGSNVVTVVLPNNGTPTTGHPNVIVSPAVTVGGITISSSRSWPVGSVIDANTYTIDMRNRATSSATVTQNNGVFPVTYSTSLIAGSGGTITTTTTAYTSTPISATDWTLANYGDTLIASTATTGGIYTWASTGAFATAQLISTAPTVGGILVSDAQQQIIGYGAATGSGSDPNYVVFCDTGNYNTWAAAVGNEAGSYRIPTGSGIVGAALTSQQILLWTDIDVWSMSYIGYPLIYGFNKIATGCGLAAQNAWVKIGSAVYWMSQNQFWVYPYGGVPEPLPCPVSDSVFGQISAANVWKIRAGGNAQFNEAVWFFPSASGSGENDTYVCYNFVENAWDMGSIARSAWCDQSIAGGALGGDPNALALYQHETSTDAAGSALNASFTTGYFCLNDGEDFNFVDWMRPDFAFPNGTGTVQVTVLVRNFAGDTPTSYGPFSFNAAAEWIDLRCRGRFIALQFQSTDTGSMWRIGRVQIRFAPDGRR